MTAAMDETVRRLHDEVEEGLFTRGVQIAIAVDGEEVLDLALGDDGLGRSMEPSTLLRIYCAIKPVTALAVGRLADDGALELDAPLHHRLPRYACLSEETTSPRSCAGPRSSGRSTGIWAWSRHRPSRTPGRRPGRTGGGADEPRATTSGPRTAPLACVARLPGRKGVRVRRRYGDRANTPRTLTTGGDMTAGNDPDHTEKATQEVDEDDATASHQADRAPTADESEAAERAGTEVPESVADAYEEAAETGANVEGEGAV